MLAFLTPLCILGRWMVAVDWQVGDQSSRVRQVCWLSSVGTPVCLLLLHLVLLVWALCCMKDLHLQRAVQKGDGEQRMGCVATGDSSGLGSEGQFQIKK